MTDEERVSNEDWRMILMGQHPELVRQRRLFRHATGLVSIGPTIFDPR